MEINNGSAETERIRVAAFIDGFNLYHAIDDLGRNNLKWVNLRALMDVFTTTGMHVLGDVFYFSAYAEWHQERRSRHMAYVRALRHCGVTPIMGNFKDDDIECHNCGHTWKAHEEKQSDVNLAVHLVREAYKDAYDCAYIVTGDSDLVPPVKLLKEIFPDKTVKVICPPGRRHSKELGTIASKLAKIKVIHLEECLLPESLATHTGLVTRPKAYEAAV